MYEFGASSSNVNDPTRKNYLFGYSGCGTGFDIRGSFSFPSGEFCLNVLIFGVDMGFSAHIDNKKKTY